MELLERDCRGCAHFKVCGWTDILDPVRLCSVYAEDINLRPTGKWIESAYQTYIPVEYDRLGEPIMHTHIRYQCDQCGRTESKKEPYCNCGARMLDEE